MRESKKLQARLLHRRYPEPPNAFGETQHVGLGNLVFCCRVVSYRHIRSIHSESTSMPFQPTHSPAASRVNSRDEGPDLSQSSGHATT